MPLSLGDHLGPYEIFAPIGAGGMGEVYRARDTRLKREVALKVLPDSFASDPERMARFQREAELLASLNHPNIATIYGVEERALAMELVEGETLASPLPIQTALEYARQIAEALEYAHERGVIHRDLKPANIKVTPEGTVKLLDFGLAKAIEDPIGSSQDPSHSPTLTLGVTRLGLILGTAAYMSPEQANGKPADRRADIWSFGAVLYEMLAGKKAFEGESVSDTLASVLKLDPDWDALPAATPSSIRKLVRRCVTKDRKKRLQAIGEARIAIEEALSGAPQEAEPVSVTAPQKRNLVLWAAATVLAIIAGATWWRATRTVEHPLQPLARLDVDLGSDVSLVSRGGTEVIISPDASRLAYISQNRLFVRRMDQSKASELAGTEGAYEPFFSPDGQWVAFFAQGKLKKISVEGGAPINLCDITTGNGGSWGEDGNIVAALNSHDGLVRLPSAGGKPTLLTELEQREFTHRWPQVLPGGKAVLFTSGASAVGDFNIEIMSLVDHRRKRLLQGGTFGRYLPSGHLVYVNGGTLFAVPFDLDRLEVRGTPAPVLEQVSNSQFGWAQMDFSRTGTLVYRSSGSRGGLVTIQWLDSAGNTRPLLAKPGAYLRLTVSPDGSRLALQAATEMWIYDWQRDTMTRVTVNAGVSRMIWSPDGRYLTFGPSGGMYWTRSDGPDQPQPLTQSKNWQIPNSFTPDGKRLAYTEISPASGYDLFTRSVESGGGGLRSGKPEVFLQTPANESYPSFSADGLWLAYQSDESGRYEVYVRAFPDKGSRWQVSNNGGLFPTFSPHSRELFYRTEDNQVMVAKWTVKGGSFVHDKPRMWTERQLANLGQVKNYDVAPDGKRIAAIMPAEGPEELRAQSHVIFLLNFFDELRRRVPVGTK